MLPFSKPAYLSISHHRSAAAAAKTSSGFTSFYFSSLVCFALNFEIRSWSGKSAVWESVVKRKAKGQTCWMLCCWALPTGWVEPVRACYVCCPPSTELNRDFMTLCFCQRNWIMYSLWPLCASTWAMTGCRDVCALITAYSMTSNEVGSEMNYYHLSSEGFSKTDVLQLLVLLNSVNFSLFKKE